MGRLTLNMLLSFAQFEREVTSECIRDKIAASKQKGMWLGGLPPLGYDVRDRKLVINEAEADRVPDRSLLRLIGQARRFHDMVINGQCASITDLAREAGVTPSWFTRVLRLNFLAPDIAKAILQGRQPITLTAKSLMLQRKLSPDWPKQRAQLGFD